MIRTLTLLVLTTFALAACRSEAPSGGGNVTLRDMEVVDGTANDAMVDLDNAAIDGTALLGNAGAAAGGNAAAPRPRRSASPSYAETAPAGDEEIVSPE